MDKHISRRSTIKLVTAGVVAGTMNGCALTSNSSSNNTNTATTDKWSSTHDRQWLGGEFWANPMEDWRVRNGGAECTNRGGNRSVHSLTHQITDPAKGFNMSVRVQRIEQKQNDGGAGIRLGARSEINEYRSNCFVQNGFDAGVLGNKLVLGDKNTPLSKATSDKEITLHLKGTAKSDDIEIELIAELSESGEQIGQLHQIVSADVLLGNVALVSNFAIEALDVPDASEDELGCRYRFAQWAMQGDAFTVNEDQKFGPVLWTMYSLNDSRSSEGFVMKLSAYVGPIGEKDTQDVELQIKKSGEWVSLGNAPIHLDGWVATFRVANWNEKKNTPFRVVYQEQHVDGSKTPGMWSGTIKANPNSSKLRMAALTCQNDYGFPYEPVANNVVKLNPDLVFFSGDQLYENHGGFGFIRTPDDRSLLNYLRKFYQFGWAFREAMQNQPTICLPDDHDVLQGNLWGEGGATMKNPEDDPGASVIGGYVQSTRIINAVHRTTLNHHPDPYDPTPTNGIHSYYGSMLYGGVSFAILADRQWKSGPERINVQVGVTGQDEDPNYFNPNYNPKGLSLLGQRQESFLKTWSADWNRHSLKAVLSQTVFAGISTHQPRPNRYLKYDFDSSGWPAAARDSAIDSMRASKALHICGDTHLGSLSQYGVDKQRDSNWAFCTPAISAGWPRWWLPDVVGLPHQNRPKHGLPETGEYLDSFGNKIYVYAIGNPSVGKSSNRYIKAHEKGSGFGVITFDTDKRTYTMEAYRFLIDVTDGKAENQFPGWPVTIHQKENAGDNVLS